MAEQANISSSTFSRFASKTRGDKVIWAIVVLLTMMSLLVVYSSTGTLAYKLSKSTESYLFKQVVFIAIGVIMIYFAHLVPYTLYSRIALFLFLCSIPLLLYTLLFGSSINEANRWIKLPIINLTFQTSDMAKLGLFMYLSRQISRKQPVIKDWKKGFLPLIIPVGVICILIAPANLSTALLVGATSLLLLFIGRASVKHIGIIIGMAAIPVAILITVAVSYYDKEEGRSKDLPAMFTKGRVETWIKRVQNFMYADKHETAYQVQQAKIAIAKGGFTGLGPGNSEARNFLPHPYSDFIYAIIIEEYGLLGGAFVLFIYLAFLFRCIRIFKRCPYAFGAFLALGLSFTLVIQAMANMAVNVNLFPVTGVTLPLVSMGGSSFLFTCVAIGIILSVARNVEQMEGRKMEPVAQEASDDHG
jgi:cell division protein FtsW